MLKLLEFSVFQMGNWEHPGTHLEVSHHEQILAVTWVDDSLCHFVLKNA